MLSKNVQEAGEKCTVTLNSQNEVFQTHNINTRL